MLIFKYKQYFMTYCFVLCNLFMHLRSGPGPVPPRRPGGPPHRAGGGPRGRDRAHRMAGAFCPVGTGPVATRAAGTCPAVTRRRNESRPAARFQNRRKGKRAHMSPSSSFCQVTIQFILATVPCSNHIV